MKLITAYHNISDGFGISMNEMSEIMSEIYDDLQLTPEVVRLLATHLFRRMDTDENGLVDGLELLSTLAIASGMKKIEMVEFSLSLYDFNNLAALCFDELVLALKSATNGLCKVHNPDLPDFPREQLPVPSEEKLEGIASQAFIVRFSDRNSEGKVTKAGAQIELTLERKNIKELTDELLSIPEVCSWLAYFCNFSELREIPQYTHEEVKDIVLFRPPPLMRSAPELSVVHRRVDYGDLIDLHEAYQWRTQVPLLTPIAFANKEISKAFPDVVVTAEWIYGFETDTCRKNVWYTKTNDIVYTSGKYAILYSSREHSQAIFDKHSECITCLSIHPNLQFFASGEDGEHPELLVWDSEGFQVLYRNRGNHHHGIAQISFSPSGTVLLSVDNSAVKTLVATNWADGTVLYKDQIHAHIALSCLLLSKDTIVVAADCHVQFWTKYTEGYVKRDGVFLKNKAKEAITCMVPSKNGDNLITGTIIGKLMLWMGINCARQVRAHSGPVTALFLCHEGYLSAGKDSRIRMWTTSLEAKFLFDVSKFGSLTSVTSVAMSSDNTSILFATKGADIFEISAIDGSDLRGGPVVKSHSSGSIFCMDTHPSKFEFVTMGSDQTLRIVEMKSRTVIRMAQLDVEGRAVAYSPAGDVIALGTNNAASSGCMFVIINEETLNILHSARDTKSPVSCMKFSPEGETLAIGTEDGAIFLYSVHDDFELVAKCTRHLSAITGLDFSIDGEWLQSNSVKGDFHFFNVDDGSYQSNIASMRDVQWQSHSCMYSWHTKAIHSLERGVERQTCCNVPMTEDKQQLVCGSNLGQVRVFSFPTVADGAECFRFHAHVSVVAETKFSFDGTLLITVGKTDRTVLQWSVQKNAVSVEVLSDGDHVENLQEMEFELAQYDTVLKLFPPRPRPTPVGVLNGANAVVSVDKFRWLAGIVDPTAMPPINVDVPNLPVHLHHVYGYETCAVRNNLCVNEQGDIVYTCASYGLVWNQQNLSQRVYQFHTNRITAFAATSDGSIVATGELGTQARVTVWNTKTLETLFVAEEPQANCICVLQFSQNGQYLAIVGNDRFHTTTVYDWTKDAVVSKFYAGESKVLSGAFVEHASSSLDFVTVGVKHIKLWRNVSSQLPACEAVNFAEIGRNQTFLTVTSFGKFGIVGTADGNLYILEGSALKQMVKAHIGGVYALHVTANPMQLFTGGHDGVVRVWDANFECVKEYPLDAISKNHMHAARAIWCNKDRQSMVVGTQGAEVLEIMLRDGSLKPGGSAVKGHSLQLCGLAVHPKQDVIASSGDDAMLRIWEIKARAASRTVKLELGSRALAFSPDGSMLAIGFGSGRRVKGKLPAKEGAFMVIQFDTLKTAFEGKDSALAITAMQFSPDGKYLAVGSEDGVVYTYNVGEQFSHRYSVKTHQAPIRSIDFSSNGHFMMTVDVAEKVFYTMASTGLSTASSDDIKDEKWQLCNNPLSWATQGVWYTQPNDCHVTTTCKSFNNQVLVAANSDGDLLLTRFPASSRVGMLCPGRHVGYVNSIRWTHDDSSFITIGKDDCMIQEWKCTLSTGTEVLQQVDFHPAFPPELVAFYEKETAYGYRAQSHFASFNSDEKDSQTTFPWRSLISEPSKASHNQPVLPFNRMQINGIQGWQRNPAQPCLHYNTEGDVIYAVSNVGVIFDRNSVHCKLYQGHVHEVSTLAINQSRDLVASADLQLDPELHIWDAYNANFVIKWKSFTRNAVNSIGFSQSGHYLVAVGEDSWHSVTVFCSASSLWQDGFVYATASVSPHPISCSLFAESRDFPVVLGGKDGILHSFQMKNGSLVSAKAKVENVARHQALTAAVEFSYLDGNVGIDIACVVCGTSEGLLYAVDNANKVLQRVSAHNGALLAISLLPPTVVWNGSSGQAATVNKVGSRLLTLGKDHCVRVWDASLRLVAMYNLDKLVVTTTLSGDALAMAYSPERSSLLLGWNQGDIWEMSLISNSTTLLTECHQARGGELHGLAWNPKHNEEFVTVGDDGFVKVWHYRTKYCIRRKNIRFASRAVAWSPDGTLIALGIGVVDKNRGSPKDGAVLILDAQTLNIVREEKKAKRYVSDVQFSPNGEQLVLSSGDGRVYVCDTQTLATLQLVDVTARRPAIRVDFSVDMSYLRIAYQPDRMVFYHLEHRETESNPAALRDVSFATHSCPFSWNTQGIFSATAFTNSLMEDLQTDEKGILIGTAAPVVTSVAVHAKRNLLFAAYESGEIRVFPYPFVDPQAKGAVLVGKLSSFASRLAVSPDGLRLVAIEAATRAILYMDVPHNLNDKLDSMIVLKQGPSSLPPMPPPPR